MKRRLGTRRPLEEAVGGGGEARAARRAVLLVEESRDLLAVLDAEGQVIAASRRARAELPALEEGARLHESIAERVTAQIPYELDGVRETLVYFDGGGDLASYQELRTGFTAAVSHELRTPLARLLALLESVPLPGADVEDLVEQARVEVEQTRELIDDVLFLSELETGREVVALGRVRALPVVRAVLVDLHDPSVRAGVSLAAEGDDELELPLRERMLRVIVENLARNAIRYAGHGACFTLALEQEVDATLLVGRDSGVGVSEQHLGRLFERFYRADRARSSRGSGLGLAIVKHIVLAAGGTVEARGGPGGGLQICCRFPQPAPS